MGRNVRSEINELLVDEKFKKSLREISHDKRQSGMEYLTSIEEMAIDFDYLMKAYCKIVKSPGPSSPPTSCDALIIKEDGRYILIEFKNGKIQSIKKDVKRKMSESALCLLDILGETVEFARENFEFILVYNEKRNSHEKLQKTRHPNNLDPAKIKQRLKKNEIQPSDFFTSFSNRVVEHAKMELILPGFELYERLWWKRVHTYTNRKFEYEFKKGL